MQQQGKYWCFTLNNYTDDDEVLLGGFVECGWATYLVYGREVGDSGTPHLQGYVELPKRLRGSQLKERLGGRVHLERRRGTAEEASEYCEKEGDSLSFGVLSVPEHGRRTDLESIRLRIDAGDSQLQIAEGDFSQWCYHRKSFEAYRSLRTPPVLRPELKVIVLKGLPGTGKTRYCYATYPDLYRSASPDLKWFDGYQGEKVVLFDDYRGGADEGFLLQLLDIYPLQVPVKGGFVRFAPDIIFLTSNLDIIQAHPAIAAPLTRRITKTIVFDNPLSVEDVEALINE